MSTRRNEVEVRLRVEMASSMWRCRRGGMFFSIGLVMLSVFVLTYGFIQLSNKTDVRDEIGENSLEMINRIQEGEKALIFVDSASRMAVYQSIYDLQAAGGISNSSRCGQYYDFNRWNSDSGEPCFVDASDAQESLKDLFTSNLVARIAKYPHADFIGNIPDAAFARGEVAAYQQAAAVEAGSVTAGDDEDSGSDADQTPSPDGQPSGSPAGPDARPDAQPVPGSDDGGDAQ